MIYTDRDASLLRMFDAFIESAPQLVLQIYLILREQENLKNCEDVEVHSRKFLSSRFQTVNNGGSSQIMKLRTSL